MLLISDFVEIARFFGSGIAGLIPRDNTGISLVLFPFPKGSKVD
jgi:hypothetical protein